MTMTKTRLMIDIETLGRDPSAVVTQIGLVRVGPGEDRREERVTLDLRRALGTVTPDTVAWWAIQDRDVFIETLRGTATPTDAWLRLQYFTKGADEVWANPPVFDFVILRDWCKRHNYECPWHWRAERDLRTLYQLKSYGPFPAVPGPNIRAHDALDDARRQMAHLLHMLGELGAL